jgi:hypothetical protein
MPNLSSHLKAKEETTGIAIIVVEDISVKEKKSLDYFLN